MLLYTQRLETASSALENGKSKIALQSPSNVVNQFHLYRLRPPSSLCTTQLFLFNPSSPGIEHMWKRSVYQTTNHLQGGNEPIWYVIAQDPINKGNAAGLLCPIILFFLYGTCWKQNASRRFRGIKILQRFKLYHIDGRCDTFWIISREIFLHHCRKQLN